MGLDVYLKKFQDYDRTQRLEAEYEARSEANWKALGKEYEQLSDDEKEATRAKNAVLARELGLDEYGSDAAGVEKIEHPSRKYPEHYFKVGYFRSSYNSGGINTVLRNSVGKDLYDIFGRERDDEYNFRPDWRAARANAIEVLEAYRTANSRTNGAVRVEALSFDNLFGIHDGAATDEQAALELYAKQCEREQNRTHPREEKCNWYSNRAGDFYFGEPMKVKAIIRGTRRAIFRGDVLPAFYVILEAQSDGEKDWYEQALEIVIETCEWALDQSDNDKLYLAWSS